MRYAVATVCDQTYAYLTSDGAVTIRHPEAMLWDTVQGAQAMISHQTNPRRRNALDASWYWIEEVLDETEFRARRDIW